VCINFSSLLRFIRLSLFEQWLVVIVQSRDPLFSGVFCHLIPNPSYRPVQFELFRHVCPSSGLLNLH
jgi:hypothetical protein